MAARAIWKGVLLIGGEKVPVKLYSAVEDRGVHFRLLHERDLVPVKQQMVNPETGEVVPFEETRRGYQTGEGDIVILNEEELEELEPEPSRDIEITHFLPGSEIDHRWYVRPYILGPDGSAGSYFALLDALNGSQSEGLAHWVMRKKEYAGVLRAEEEHLALITLRHTEQVVPMSELEAPAGREIDEKEMTMAQQLISMLEGEFEPERYEDEYRGRVLELVERKARGETIELRPVERRPPAEDLRSALQRSLREARERKSA
jgi:DNA end-binding protein Ku